MTLLMSFFSLLVFVLLVFITALRPAKSPLSWFELRRREAAGDQKAKEALRREALLALASRLKQPASSFLAVLLTALLVGAFGWMWGLVVAVVAVLLSERIAALPFTTKLAAKTLRRREAAWLELIARHEGALRLLAGKNEPHEHRASFGSIEELMHAIDASQRVLSAGDKKLVTGALGFRQRRVGDVMTPRDDIVAVAHTELLGPLVLSDLHKTGHSCFPVINGDLDHVVGILDTRSQFALEAKRSLTAAKTMMPKVFTVRSDQSLDDALATFVHTRHHLLMVVDEGGKTLGLISLGDVLSVLFGERIAQKVDD